MELDRADEEVLLEKVPQQLPAGQRDERKDHFFAVVFAANLAAVSFIALVFGLPNVSSIYFTVHRDDESSHGVKIFLIFLATSCIGGAVSMLWLQVLQNHAARVISWTLKFSIVAFVVASLASFYDSGMAGKAIGFINLFFALTIVSYYSSVRRSIAFAASNLAAASRILRVFPGVISSAYMALLAQAAWVVVWSVAVVGVLAKAVGNLHDSSSFGNTCFFFMLLSFYWFVHVAKNVVHCITAGAVGEWWFGANDVNTIQRAQTRALTTSLGSICIGSLVVAFLNTLHTILLSTPRRKAKGSANAFLAFLVKLVLRNMQYFNKYAFCQVALYGKDFRLAGTDTMHLFRDRGWSALLNDSLISNVLAVGCLVVGTTSGVIGSAWLYLTLRCTPDELSAHPEECQTFNVVVLTFAACASIGYAMCAIVSSILDSMVATIFVCFAEDPAALQRSHPDEHARLVEAWGRLQPDLLSYPAHIVYCTFALVFFANFKYKRCASSTALARVNSTFRDLPPKTSASNVEIPVNAKNLPLEPVVPVVPVSPLAVQVLRYRSEEKGAPTSLKKSRFVYEIETCHYETGDVFHTERRFREFKRLREALLLECRDCPECRPFAEKLKQSRLPGRHMVVLDVKKYGNSRMLELTHFLRDLVRFVAQYAHHCARDGPDIDKSVGLFLGLDSLSEALDGVVSSARSMQMIPLKTRQERIDFRSASMPDMRFSSSSLRLSDGTLQYIRARGYTYTENGDAYAQQTKSRA
ncbi:hypothetical protein JM18_002453 [Phytophthora kernoviae]|uniref:Choline transporter-like protein n=2 Tax=Phytophthora kernoviae TaxID=325452 RepID=A0A8T0M456_9STRA|nr:hypothetical protein G195_003989 [Phytophthora kernoviae 00238/432]KAG2527057.1 hypothetical protein JM16_002909 [Phytophthora kernoviae]KAG2530026.1 hypothetical protein JM18_002453 [Phytophthora kernoviae]